MTYDHAKIAVHRFEILFFKNIEILINCFSLGVSEHPAELL